MFSMHTIAPKPFKVRNSVLLFLSIFLGLGSIAVRAADTISIDTTITNAVQTIMKIMITSDGTDGGDPKLEINGTL